MSHRVSSAAHVDGSGPGGGIVGQEVVGDEAIPHAGHAGDLHPTDVAQSPPATTGAGVHGDAIIRGGGSVGGALAANVRLDWEPSWVMVKTGGEASPVTTVMSVGAGETHKIRRDGKWYDAIGVALGLVGNLYVRAVAGKGLPGAVGFHGEAVPVPPVTGYSADFGEISKLQLAASWEMAMVLPPPAGCPCGRRRSDSRRC